LSQQPAPPSTPAPSSHRGRGLNDTEKRRLIEICIHNQETYLTGTKRQFWILITSQFSQVARFNYSNSSVSRNVGTLVDRRRTDLQLIETGETQESNPQLNEVLDQ
jgi:hypothetical protein